MLGKSSHTERYRVVADACWPRDAHSSHNARYTDDYEEARNAYMHLVLVQINEERMLERVTFECRNENRGTYAPMFESYQRHTIESYGLD